MDPTGHIFGNSKLKEIKTGDLVRWHTLSDKLDPGYKENIGIVTNVHVDHRGGRDVAMAKIIPLGSENNGDQEIEVFLACLKVISQSVI
jgi:hypothetical protein|tara:strand:- start:825 stop:1091 length:267 start_codon:yes stop_codon:yes gene_type:complete